MRTKSQQINTIPLSAYISLYLKHGYLPLTAWFVMFTSPDFCQQDFKLCEVPPFALDIFADETSPQMERTGLDSLFSLF